MILKRFPALVVMVIDLNMLTQTNHTIYDYGSFGFMGSVLAGGTTMVADGYRFAHLSFKIFMKRNGLQQEAPHDPCCIAEETTRGLDEGRCHLDKAGEGERNLSKFKSKSKQKESTHSQTG